jgi:hypothetical protein
MPHPVLGTTVQNLMVRVTWLQGFGNAWPNTKRFGKFMHITLWCDIQLYVYHMVHTSVSLHQPFNTGIKSIRATLPGEIFYWDFASWTVHFLIYAWKTNKCNNYSFSLLIMYGSSYLFRHYIAILSELQLYYWAWVLIAPETCRAKNKEYIKGTSN